MRLCVTENRYGPMDKQKAQTYGGLRFSMQFGYNN